MSIDSSEKGILYLEIYKYLSRSFGGELFADQMVERLIKKAYQIDPLIYEDAYNDALNDMSPSDYQYLGTPIVGVIRSVYKKQNDLDEYFNLYQPSKDKYSRFSFKQFCTNNNFNSDDIAIFPITGDSMINAGIDNGDTAIVNISLKPQKGDIAAVIINSKYFIKRIGEESGCVVLISENNNYLKYKIKPEDNFRLIGKVTNIIKSLK